MQEIPRALLLPPPSSARANTRGGALALDQDQVEVERNGERGPKRTADSSFLTLIESRPEDSVELKGKQFRFRPYTNRGGAERSAENRTIERRDAAELAAAETEDGQAAREVLIGFASGDGSRNSTAFLASFIAQERLSEGLHNPPHGDASDAYRRAGGSPPPIEDRPRVVSFAA